MKKIQIILTLILLLVLTACGNDSISSKNQNENLVNPLNSSYLNAESVSLNKDSNNKYYFLSDNKVYKLDNNTEEIQFVTDLEVNQISFTFTICNDLIFYCKSNSLEDSMSENGEVLCKNIKTGEMFKISDDWCNSIICDGESIYYYAKYEQQNIYTTALKRYNIKSKALEVYTETVNSVYMCNVFLDDDFIYYSENGVYRINKNDITCKPECIKSFNAYQQFSYVMMYNHTIFYTDIDFQAGGEICSLDLNNRNAVRLINGKDFLLQFDICKDMIFYQNNGNLYMTDLNGKDEKLILKNLTDENGFILNGKLFYGDNELDGKGKLTGKYVLKSINLITGQEKTYRT